MINTVIFSLARYVWACSQLAPGIPRQPEEYQAQDGIIIGNVTNKDAVSNPIEKRLVQRFDQVLLEELETAAPQAIYEIGCGEGRLAKKILQSFAVPYRGSDFSSAVIATAREFSLPNARFDEASIYELQAQDAGADTIVCCEVLEHLEHPEQALEVMRRLSARQYILSVPCEPLWRLLNQARLAYLEDHGNTPGHLNHWSPFALRAMLRDHHFEIESLRLPLPWVLVRGRFLS